MQIVIHTKNGQLLLKNIYSKIDSGELKTWEIRINKNQEVLFNNTPEQWAGKVLLKPDDHYNGFKIITTYWSSSPAPNEANKGYIIGRFIEILMVHFKDQFSKLEVS